MSRAAADQGGQCSYGKRQLRTAVPPHSHDKDALMHHAGGLVGKEVPQLLAADTAHGCTACRMAAPITSRQNLDEHMPLCGCTSACRLCVCYHLTGRWCPPSKSMQGQGSNIPHLLFLTDKSRFPMHYHNARPSSGTLQSACPVDPTNQQLTGRIPAPQIWTAAFSHFTCPSCPPS
jgi:hypothetical protein